MTIADRMREQLAKLEPASVEIVDESAQHAGHAGAAGGGGHYRLTIVSPQFAGKVTIERHRMVYHALGPLMQREIHALGISAKTPDEL